MRVITGRPAVLHTAAPIPTLGQWGIASLSAALRRRQSGVPR
ncbi:IPTL-CTERM sorting domain-containing protein [Diaphorobacter sp. HDW4A]